MKVKRIAKQLAQIFRLSEDYDSDESDIESDLKFMLKPKKISKKLKAVDHSNLELVD